LATRIGFVFSVALLAACGGRGRIGVPPDIFPVSTAWVVLLEDAPLGELATDGQRIFVSSRDGLLRALSPETGDVLWQVPNRAGWLAARPGVLVLRQRDGSLWRIDPQTGSASWRTATGIEGELPPRLDGAGVLVAGRGIAAVDLSDGHVVWSDTSRGEVTAPPSVSAGWVFSGERSGALHCRNRETGALEWTHETHSPLWAPPLLDDRNRLFLGTTARRFVALDPAKDGRERWRWRLGADVTAGSALLGNRVLFASFENVLYALKRSNGHLIWRAPLPSRPLAAPILLDSIILVACHEN
jgi:outer membrane protein assembly factor BamB